MRFSLILCTVGRDQVLREHLESLAAQQNPPSFEVILVDQNKDGRLLPIIADFENRFPIRRFTAEPGLSRARNIGLSHAQGDIIAFPDDDCTYPPTLLRSVSDVLEAEDIDGISIMVTDRQGHLSGCYMHRSSCRITFGNVWHSGVSISIFIKLQAIGGIRFDETLGVGSGTIFGSGEETDFLIHLIKAGKRLDFRPELVVNHPVFKGPWSLKRGYLYGSGMGRVLSKHRYGFFKTLYFASLQLVRAFLAVLKLNFPRMMFHLAMSYGRITGYFRKPPEQ